MKGKGRVGQYFLPICPSVLLPEVNVDRKRPKRLVRGTSVSARNGAKTPFSLFFFFFFFFFVCAWLCNNRVFVFFFFFFFLSRLTHQKMKLDPKRGLLA